LSAAALLSLGPSSCAAGFRPASEVDSLRVLAVTADRPYAQPDEEVSFAMTVADGLGPSPRDVQVLWLGGCYNPAGDQYFACFEQLAGQLAALGAAGPGAPDADWALDTLPAEQSGQPDAATFTITVPEDVLEGRDAGPGGTSYAVGFVFFAACAGTLAPGDFASLDAWSADDATPEFPVRCLGEDGLELGAESFVPGYTQLYVFADGRSNENPTADGMTLDGADMPEGETDLPAVPLCPRTDEQRRSAGCLADTGPECPNYRLLAQVGDLAETDPAALDPDGNPLRELVWVSYFADGGTFTRDIAVISDPTTGYLGGEHEAGWLAPPEPGIVTIWAVVRDSRGGGKVVRRMVRVE